MGNTRLDMTTEKINTQDLYGLYTQYNWFSQAYPPIMQNACDEFFLPGFQFILLGISKNVNMLMDKDSYFVTKVRIDKFHDMFFRLSENVVSIILDRALGKSDVKFSLNRLTDLEAKVITAFNDYMFNNIKQFFIPAPPVLKRTNFDIIHLTFLLKDVEKNISAKLIVSLPEILLKPDAVESSGDKFSYDNFSNSTLDASVKVGTTRIKLIDVKNIDVDDIVVFDKSDTRQMVLKFGDYEKDIKINPNPGLIVPFDNDGGEVDMAENTNLWDSIEVEMNAQFDTVKITLGELKNIEEGLVVDLTSIYDNKVTLSVEDKPIARGELVIVNDRYGVKIDEILTLDKPQNTNEEEIQEEIDNNETQEDLEPTYEEEQLQEQPQETSEEDEFDYSDFELEDEDI